MNTDDLQPEVEEIARSIGFAISNWGKVETVLSGLYATVLQVPEHATARDAFYSIVSFQGKIKALDACFKREFRENPSVLKQWSAVKKACLIANDQRNQLAHGVIQMINTETPFAGWFPFWNGSQVEKALGWDGNHAVIINKDILRFYSSAEIKTITESFNSVHDQANALLQDLSESLHSKRQP
jgi:hypothetical protein